MTQRLLHPILTIILVLSSCFAVWPQPAQANNGTIWLDSPLSDASSGFDRAIAPRDWQFPQDFGPHVAYQTEWWYYTGNLETAEGRPFGFQLTFFRQALQPERLVPTEATGSPWRSNQIYSAHFTVSDIAQQRFYPNERFSRGSVELAGATAEPYQVWLANWSATEVDNGQVRLQAQTSDAAIDLVLTQRLSPILHGDRGLIQKGLEPGAASYYYSLVQQPTTGTLTLKGQTYAVKGVTWKDHEYATNPLSVGTLGWDWFSIQFDNGAALMLYRFRHVDDSLESLSAGTFVSADGAVIPLSWKDWRMQVLDTWKSAKSGATYPAQWQLSIAKLDLTLRGKSLLPNQELSTSTATYWEGMVAFQGELQGQDLEGKGYVELTGYADRLDGLLAGK